MSAPRFKVGIVGFGVMGARHARVFGALDSEFEIAGAFDPHAAVIPGHLRVFVDLEELVEASDLVIVANPIEAHVDTTLRALSRGRHVLVEKPIASTAREAAMLLERATEKQARLFVGHSERFHPVTRALAASLEGEQILAMAFRRIANGTPRDASLRSPMADALLNLAVHDIDLAAYLGRTEVELSVARRRGALAAIELVAKTGWRATIDAGRTSELPERTLAIETASSSYRADLKGGTLVAVDRTTGERRPVSLPTEEPLAAQAAAIAAVLRGLSSDVARAADGIRAVAVAERALVAIETPVGTAENL